MDDRVHAAAGGPAGGLLRRATYWLEPRWRDPGWLAFAINRLTGVIVFGYLVAHMIVLSQLAAGPSGWDSLVEIFGSRPFLVGDTLLIGAVTFHALSGVRVILLTFGLGTRHSTALFGVVLVASTILMALAGWAILAR
jgi:succinate dehydrogenase / fumarate reductase cytochrome b subunit